MLTRCPTCQTTFRVTAEQLKARQGRVRCGHCQGVFNALETLIEETPSAAPAAAPSDEPVVIHGFDIPALGDPAPTPSFPAATAVVEPAAVDAAVASAPTAPAAEGETVAEPSVEYVHIGDLTLEEIEAEGTFAAAEETVEDELARTEITIPAIDDGELDLTEAEFALEPSPDDQFTKTVVGFTWYVEPEPPAPAADLHPSAEDFAKTVVQSVRIAEAEVPAEPASEAPVGIDFAPPPAPAPNTPFEPAGATNDDWFAKTVVQSIRMLEPEMPAAAEVVEPAADVFAATMVQPRRTVEPPAAAEAPASVFAFPTIEPLASEAPGAKALTHEPAADEFARTMVDVPPMAGPADKDFAEEDEFELAPIDVIQVEEVTEPPSIVDLSVPTPTTFPTLPPLAEGDDQAADESANAILDQLAAGAPPASEWEPSHETAGANLPILEDETATIPLRKADRAALGVAAAAPAAEDETQPPVVQEAVAIPELQELPARRRWPWLLGSLLALCLLGVQAVVHYRVELSVLMPRSKPALVALCEVFDCKVPLPSQIDLIGIETSDLSPGPEGSGHLQLAATLRNRAPFVQAWPDLELTLTDNADKALVRRVLAPADYLPPGHKPGAGFAARSEQTVYLDLKAPGVPAVGYRLYVFYP